MFLYLPGPHITQRNIINELISYLNGGEDNMAALLNQTLGQIRDL